MMLNKTTLLLGLLFFLFSSHIFAHSHMETNTNPPAQVEPVKKIEIAATDSETVMKTESTEINQITSSRPAVINYVLPVIIGLVIVLGFGSYWLIFRRKQF